MSRYGDRNVIARGVIMWDGVTQPEQKDDGKGGKRTQYSIKIALQQGQPEINEINAIATDALNADTTFKGRLPAGGCWPILPVDAQQFEGRLPNHVAFNAKTYRAPQVYDINNQEMAPMIYGPLLYPGCIVEVLCSAFAFANVSKGIALSLDGIKVIDATAPRLPVGGVDAGAAFGGAPAPGPQARGYASGPVGQPVYTPPPVQGGQSGYTPPPQPVNPANVTPAPQYMQPPPVPGQAPPPAPPAPAPAHQMTALAAGASYESFIAAGWNDAQLVANGYML